MGNDRIDEAEAGVGGNGSASGDASEAVGKRVVAVKNGDKDVAARRSTGSEETPLLEHHQTASERSEDDRLENSLGEDSFANLSWWRQPSIYWSLPILFVSALAIGGISVPKLNLIIQLICREYMSEQAAEDPSFSVIPVLMGEDNPQCQIPEVSARSAQFALASTLISGCLSAIVSPQLGALSDRYGRKPIFLYCASGLFVTELFTIAAAKYPETVHVTWLLVGSGFDGLCGSFITWFAISSSYVADCTLPQRRSVSFALLHGCFFTGIAFGPIMAAYIIKATGTVLTVFYIALGTNVWSFLFLLLFVPESLSKRRQMAAREKHRVAVEELGPAADWINTIRSFNLFAPLKILWPTGPGVSRNLRSNLVLLAATDTIMFAVSMGAMSVVVFYSEYAFKWGNFETSRFVSMISICRVSCLFVVLPLASHFIKGSSSQRALQRPTGTDKFDLGIIRLAILFDTMGFVGYALAKDPTSFTISGAIASFGGIGSPTLQAALTRHVPNDKIGQLLGATGLLHAFGRVLGPLVSNSVYAATIGKFNEAVFVCLAVTFGLAFACSWFIRPHVHLDDLDSDESDESDASVEPQLLPGSIAVQRSQVNGAAVPGFVMRVSTTVFLSLVAAWSFAIGGGG